MAARGAAAGTRRELALTLWVLAVVLAALALALALHPASGTGAHAAGAALGAGALGAVAGALALRRPRRARASAHLAVRTGPPVLRGGQVEARVDVRPGLAGAVRVGLVCTERYGCLERRPGARGRAARVRVTREAPVHEEWLDLDGTPGSHPVRFPVPAGALYSHEGDAVSYLWQVVAREPGRGGEHAAPVWVLP